MSDFLLEIGSEELPSRFLPGEQAQIAELFQTALDEAGLSHGQIRALATPRRLALIVEDLAPSQAEKEDIVTGPPARIAYDPNGEPTKALAGFAATNNVALDQVFRLDTPKGEYVAIRKKSGGKPAKELLAEICPGIIESLPFAKRMRWGANQLAYARPLRWIVALLDNEIVEFAVGPVKSGRITQGHRVMGNGPATVPDVAKYGEALTDACAVTLDPEARRKLIVDMGNALARQKGGQIIWKDDLLEEVEGLVEHPLPMLGDFDPAYLEIPAEVLLTSMQSHQKSFGVQDAAGNLLPHFLTVLNLEPKDPQVVKRGWERVLKARLEDARFFWRADLTREFQEWLDKLKHVIFIGPLGNMGEKARRLEKLCAWLANAIVPRANAELAARAGLLAKADLVSGMVGEFDTLQGIMGGIYADRAGEPGEVAQAIREQYLPAGPNSPLPQSVLGAILSIADKADTLAGCFGLGMIPTGMADPNGLRRCALGIIRIMLDQGFEFPIGELFDKARKLYGERKWKLSGKEATEKLLAFFEGRLLNYFLGQGYDINYVNAALAPGIERIPDCAARLDALVAFGKEPGFASSLQTLKRVDNIAKKAGETANGAVNEKLLTEKEEIDLYRSLASLLPELDAKLERRDYSAALATLADLRQPVDNFFDQVMVLCEDLALRANRLNLLASLSQRFAKIGDFGQLQA